MTRDRYKKPRKIEQWRGVGSYGTIGLEIVLSISFGFFGGRWLDEKFSTAPYLAGLGFFFGVGAAIKAVMRAHDEMKQEAAREEREQGNPQPLYEVRDDKPNDAEVRQDEPSESSDDESLEDKTKSSEGKADR